MNTTELISALKIKGSFPTSDDLFSNSDFLVLLNMQMKAEIMPLLLSLSEDYFLLSKDYTITQGSTYRLPERAIGSKLRDVTYVDASGSIGGLPRLFEEDRRSNKSGYYLVRNSIELSSEYNQNTLRIKYFARPNDLVLVTDCAKITSIDTLNNQVTCSSVPTTFTTGVLCDFIQHKNPYDLIDYDYSIVGIAGTTITFSTLPTDLVVGNYVTLSNEAPVPMVPEELHPILVQSALVSCLSSKKDKALEFEVQRLEEMKQTAITILDPRVENDSLKFRSGKLIDYFSSRW